MRALYHQILVFTFSVYDLLSAVISFGLYGSEFLDGIVNAFQMKNYSIWDSHIEFLFISILRVLAVVSQTFMIRFGKIKETIWFNFSAAFLTFVLTVMKLLALDETPGLLSNLGVILNIVFSIMNSVLLWAVIGNSILAGNLIYQVLDNEPESIGNGETASSSPENETRLNSKTQLWEIVKLASVQKAQFFAVSVFKFAYCLAMTIDTYVFGQVLISIGQPSGFWENLEVFIWSLIMTVIFCLLETITMDRAKTSLSVEIRLHLFGSVVNQSVSFFDTNNTGDLQKILSKDCDNISSEIAGHFGEAITQVFYLCLVLPPMLRDSWQLTVVECIFQPILIVVNKNFGSSIEEKSEAANKLSAHSAVVIQETLTLMRTVRSFGTEGFEYERFKTSIKQWAAMSLKVDLLRSLSKFSTELILAIKTLVMLVYAHHLVLIGEMEKETIVSYCFCDFRLNGSSKNLFSTYTDITKCIGESRKTLRLMKQKPELNLSNGTEKPEISGVLVMENIEFAYPSRKGYPVIKNFNLKIEPGKVVALIGHSGNGKTTITSLIKQYYFPDEGRITLDGVDIRNIDSDHYHKYVTEVCQEPALFSGSIKYNILYGVKEEISDERFMEVVEMANVHEFVKNFEKQYETECGEKGVRLSGGQKQRIAIARAMIRDPKFVIFDEATSALDAESESKIQEAIYNCSKNRAVLIIAHRLSTIRNADKICVLHGRKIAEEGNHDELMLNKNGIYRSFVSKQMC